MGLAILGECCPLLKELHISRCTGLASWAMNRVWTGCNNLEVLDMSYMTQLTDQDICEMAEK